MRRMLQSALIVFALHTAVSIAPASARVLDDFESLQGWQAQPASGVKATLALESVGTGHALRMDFDFQKGGGYAVLRKAITADVPAHYEFTFRLRARAKPNHVEFKLVDASGENVWWSVTRDHAFTGEWETFRIKKRHVSFAWGPRPGDLQRFAALEFAITAGQGGEGSVWFDDLTLDSMPPPPPWPPVASVVTPLAGRAAVDGDSLTGWVPKGTLTLDLGARQEFGGLALRWAPTGDVASRVQGLPLTLERSDDGKRWHRLAATRLTDRGRDLFRAPESEARFLRLTPQRVPAGMRLASLEFRSLAWGASPDSLWREHGRHRRRGELPRAMLGERARWAVVGVDRAREEALLSEDGALEVGKGQWSVEPFVVTSQGVVRWSDVTREHGLADGDLPMPWVRWRHPSVELTTSVFAEGVPGRSSVLARYRVHNPLTHPTRVTLALAIRPFQVNPPAQFLNAPGGVARISRLERAGGRVLVDGVRGVLSLTQVDGYMARRAASGDVAMALADMKRTQSPASETLVDSSGLGSGALLYTLELPAGGEREVLLRVPLDRAPSKADAMSPAEFDASERSVRASWREKLDRLTLEIPGEGAELARLVRSQLAWLLINRDGAAIQPGSRSYERSWIRDGSLSCSAMLMLGHGEDVLDYIRWFTPFLYADGKVPCCVDHRGSDPVPEHDSDGEYLFLLAEYVRRTGDLDGIRPFWPSAIGVAHHLDSLRLQRRTPEWRTPERAHFFGLLPPSISHEGYSAKPMHSYWDDLFALRGFKDVIELARRFEDRATEARYSAVLDTFSRDLRASVEATMRVHRIDYMPGCADLGDADATSTTIALTPVAAEGVLPMDAVRATFEDYWGFFQRRASGEESWDAFTPYEVRVIGSMARLGHRDRALALTEWFLAHRDPPAWNQWAEVVARDTLAQRFIGDIPHTWVGSDFVRSVLDLVAYEDETAQQLVIGASVSPKWFAAGDTLRLAGLPTRWGRLETETRATSTGFEVRVGALSPVPAGGVVVCDPGSSRASEVLLDGAPVRADGQGRVRLARVPATVTFRR